MEHSGALRRGTNEIRAVVGSSPTGGAKGLVRCGLVEERIGGLPGNSPDRKRREAPPGDMDPGGASVLLVVLLDVAEP